MHRSHHLAVSLLSACGFLLASCGGGDDDGSALNERGGSAFDRAVAAAQKVSASDFPAPGRQTLSDLGKTVGEVQLGLATMEFTPGKNRLAFGVLTSDNSSFIYGKSAVYIARTPEEVPEGPFPAPADPLVVEPAFRSRTAAAEKDSIAAIYAAEVDLRPGRYAVLAVTKTPQGLVGGGTFIRVKRSSPVPAVGDRPPPIETETVASAAGNIESIETRIPEDDMHEESFADVIGKKPVVLLMATPALCQTRVCGPVTDIAAQLQKEYGDKATFIHQEVYEDNKVQNGLREPLRKVRPADGAVAVHLQRPGPGGRAP